MLWSTATESMAQSSVDQRLVEYDAPIGNRAVLFAVRVWWIGRLLFPVSPARHPPYFTQGNDHACTCTVVGGLLIDQRHSIEKGSPSSDALQYSCFVQRCSIIATTSKKAHVAFHFGFSCIETVSMRYKYSIMIELDVLPQSPSLAHATDSKIAPQYVTARLSFYGE